MPSCPLCQRHPRPSLWANTHATHSYLPDDLAGFLKRHPQVSVSLEERTSTEIAMAVAHGEIDVGVLADAGAQGAGVVLWPYRQTGWCSSPQGHALAQRASVAFAEVLDQAFVMLHSGSAIHTFTMNAAAALGRHLDVRIQVRSFEAVCRMVGAGVGIGLVPRSAVPRAGLSEPPVVVAGRSLGATRPAGLRAPGGRAVGLCQRAGAAPACQQWRRGASLTPSTLGTGFRAVQSAAAVHPRGP
jgi:DNA-binding transcriptional LysR family regulator